MFIYRKATDVKGIHPAIVLNQKGDIGKYNRANLSIHHFIQDSLPLIASLPISFYLFSLPTFVLMSIFFVGLILDLDFAKLVSAFTNYVVLGLMIVAYTKMVF